MTKTVLLRAGLFLAIFSGVAWASQVSNVTPSGEYEWEMDHGERGWEMRHGETGWETRHGERGWEMRHGELGWEQRHGSHEGEVERESDGNGSGC